MSRVEDLSDRYANFMRNPAPSGSGVCSICWTLIDPSFTTCWACGHQPNHLNAVVPLTYSIDLGQMHVSLRGYKDGWAGDRSDSLRNRLTSQLAAVLTRFLRKHEACIAAAAGVGSFDVVTTVPSSTTTRDDEQWRLRWILETGCPVTKDRYVRLLDPTLVAAAGKTYDRNRYATRASLTDEAVLLIDDTWTQGRSAQSAAAALEAAGASAVALAVLGRHIVPTWQPSRDGVTCEDLLKTAPPWSWDDCAVHQP